MGLSSSAAEFLKLQDQLKGLGDSGGQISASWTHFQVMLDRTKQEGVSWKQILLVVKEMVYFL